MASAQRPIKRVYPRHVAGKKQDGKRVVMLTCYDYAMARTLDAVDGVDVLLVGDSLAMTMLGHPDTLSVTMEEMLVFTRAVCRGTSRALVVADMPFMSYQVSVEDAIRNAGRFFQAGAQAVKLEGATAHVLVSIQRLVESGMPVMGHLGYTPQAIQHTGGPTVQGKTDESARRMLADARALEAAGAFAIVLEMVPVDVGKTISEALTIPTIGIGAGSHCDGQVLVIDDLLGRYPDFRPKFARTYAELVPLIREAVTTFAHDVGSGTFPDNGNEAFTGAARAVVAG